MRSAIDLSAARVLVVEDDALIALAMTDMLYSLGARDVTLVDNVGEALTALKAKPFDLVALDIKLGEENGLVVAQQCAIDGTPVIYATGFGDVFVPATTSSEQLLPKPYNIGSLSRAISRFGKFSVAATTASAGHPLPEAI